MNVLIDVDEVIRGIVQPCIDIYKRDFDPDSNVKIEDIKFYDMSKHFPKIENIIDTFFGKYSSEVFLEKALPYPGVVDAMRRMSKHHFLHIATHQFRGNEQYTLEWLKRFDIPFDAISFISEKSFIFGHAIIDDNIKYLEDFKQHKLYNGMGICCMSRPWNSNWSGDRVNTFEDFEKYVEVMSESKRR